jgi:hypothetical protein
MDIKFKIYDNQNRSMIQLFLLKKLMDGDEGMTPRVLTFGLRAATHEQDGQSRPKNPKTN